MERIEVCERKDGYKLKRKKKKSEGRKKKKKKKKGGGGPDKMIFSHNEHCSNRSFESKLLNAP